MVEFDLPFYCKGELPNVKVSDMPEIIKDLINEVVIENRTYYDNGDRREAIEILYPIVAIIISNSNFPFVKHHKEKLVELITYLVTHLS